jgi:hypothetical protein
MGKSARIRTLTEAPSTPTNPTDEPWNPAAPTSANPQTPKTYPIRMVLADYTEGERANSTIGTKDQRALISVNPALDLRDASGTLITGADEYAIITIRPLEPGPVIVLYEAQVRA